MIHDHIQVKFCKFFGRGEIGSDNTDCGDIVVFELEDDHKILSIQDNEEVSGVVDLTAEIFDSVNDVQFLIRGYGYTSTYDDMYPAIFDSENSYWRASIDSNHYADGNYLVILNYSSDQYDSYSRQIPITINNSGDTNIINLPENSNSSINVNKTIVEIIEESGADPQVQGVEMTEELEVLDVTTEAVVVQNVNDTPVLIFNGTGPPNTKLTLFIYSELPLIVQVETDESGNWNYTLEDPLHDGEHIVYVTITDDTGKIEKKSSPLQFFVKEAQSITEEEFLKSTATAAEKSSSALRSYIIIAVSLVGLVVILFLGFKMRKKPTGDNI